MKPTDPQGLMAWGFSHGNVDDLRESLSLGANPNGPISSLWNMLPLYRALDMSTCSQEMVACLLEYQADPSLSYASMYSAFTLSIINGFKKNAELMLPVADLLRMDSWGSLASVHAMKMPLEFLEKMQTLFEQNFLPLKPELHSNHLWLDLGFEGLAAIHAVSHPLAAQWLFTKIPARSIVL